MLRHVTGVLLLLCTCLCTAHPLLQGTRSIQLISAEGDAVKIADIHFSEHAKGVQYKIELNEEHFQDEFLSMRPFKCLHLPEQMLCHLSYPYAKQGYITKDDLLDLEYDLLFLHKTPQEYGINAWNGIYYRLSLSEDQSMIGTLMEVDLNILAAPPEDGVLRPITSDMLYEAEPSAHPFIKLIIR